MAISSPPVRHATRPKVPSSSRSGVADHRAVDFIQKFCRLSKGEWYGQLIELRPWQREIVNALLTLRPDGLRQHRIGYIGMPRKQGKSTLGAALALYGLIADKEPGAEVYSVAGDRRQAEIVFTEAKRMVELDPALSKMVRIQRYHLEVPSTSSIYRVLSADAKLQQGLNPSMVLFDEVHVQPREDLWSAMTLGSGTRRQPLVVGITTAGFDRGSLAWRLYEYGRKVASGEIEDPTFFFRWFEPRNLGADWTDPKVWVEANPALDPSKGEPFLKMEDFESTIRSTPEHEFRRFRLNQWTTTRDAWLPHGAWEAIADPTRVVDPETPCVLFFDGSWTGDSTGIAGMTLEERPHLFVVDAWEPSETGRHVERSDVERAIYKATEDHRVSYIGADPHEWRGELQKWYDDGLPIVEWPTNAVARMVEACGEFYRGVMTKAFTHDGDPRLLRHITNAVVKVDRIGARIVKNSSREKIDLAVCAVGAYDLVLRHRDEDFSDATVTLLD